ncbi:MAG: hypothetical protein DHS20C18_47640 [Saprospiraceae bacterium]|nr:MAG: hypothetical protein DHS20C18_47640 [Saprospiraceae bacterium]
MKNSIVITTLLLVLPLLSYSQDQNILQFYEKYQNIEEVTNITLQGWVLKMASEFSDEAEVSQILNKITKLRVLVMEGGNLVSQQECRDLVKKVKQNRFEDLMQIRDGGQVIEFLIREDKETITDVLVLISGDDQFVLLSLEGALKFSDLNNLNIDIEGGEHFKKIPEKKKDLPRA